MAKKTTDSLTGLSKAEQLIELKKSLEKDYGKGSIMGANDSAQEHPCISTGSVGLNKALGIGGYPKGRIVEIFGWESSGKTTLALEAIAEAHKADSQAQCAIVDAEYAIDLGYAKALGVDIDRLDISQPDSGDDALNITEKLIKSGLYAIVVVDSVAALTPQSEIDGEMGDSSMGKHARLMSQAMRKLVGITSKSSTVLIFINQVREKIGVMFGNPETTTGGNALKFYASVRMRVSRSVTTANSIVNKDDEKIGNQTKVQVVKNKLAPPFRECEFDIRFGEGIDTAGEVLELAERLKIIEKSGSSYSYNGTILGRGKEASRLFLHANEPFLEEIKEKISDSFKPQEFTTSEKVLEESLL